jgi:hypothetical protein
MGWCGEIGITTAMGITVGDGRVKLNMNVGITGRLNGYWWMECELKGKFKGKLRFLKSQI